MERVLGCGHVDLPDAIVERDGPVITVTLNRPQAKNALSGEMLVGMYDAWKALDEDPELRVGILTGAGGHFCSGMDLKSLAGGMDDQARERMSDDPDLHWKALLRHFRPSKPIIAAVEGYAWPEARRSSRPRRYGWRGRRPVRRRRGPARAVPPRRVDRPAPAADPVHDRRRPAADRPAHHRPGGRRHRPHRPRGARRPGAGQGPRDRRSDRRQRAHRGAGRAAVDPRDRRAARGRRAGPELELGWPVFATKDAKEGPKAFAEKRPAQFTGT